MKLLSNAEYNRLQAAIAEKENYISEREYKFLQSEITFWREKYEAERERANRAVDTLVEGTGALPISDLGLQQVEKKKNAVDQLFEKRQRELGEMYSEAINEFDDESSTDVAHETNAESIEISE